MSSDRGFLIDWPKEFHHSTPEKCTIEPIPGKKMKVVPLPGIPRPRVVNFPRKVIVHKIQTTNLMSIKQRRWFAWRGVLITARRDTTKLRRFINKELRKQRRCQMFRYREMSILGWAVASALGGIQLSLIALKLAKVWDWSMWLILSPVIIVIIAVVFIYWKNGGYRNT